VSNEKTKLLCVLSRYGLGRRLPWSLNILPRHSPADTEENLERPVMTAGNPAGIRSRCLLTQVYRALAISSSVSDCEAWMQCFLISHDFYFNYRRDAMPLPLPRKEYYIKCHQRLQCRFMGYHKWDGKERDFSHCSWANTVHIRQQIKDCRLPLCVTSYVYSPLLINTTRSVVRFRF